MITSVDEALDQNKKLIDECFKLTQKYECSEKELSESRQRVVELEDIMTATNGSGLEDENEILQKLISAMTELRKKNKQIEEDRDRIELFSQKSSEMRQLLNEMTKKYIEVARVNTETVKKMKTMQECQSKEDDKQVEIENLMEKGREQMEAMKSTVKNKEAIIDRLTQEIMELGAVKTMSSNGDKEISDLKNKIAKRDEELKNLLAAHSVSLQRNNELKKNNLMLNEAQHRIEYLSQKANEWYHAYRDSQQQIQVMRKQQGASRSCENTEFESLLIEANQRILHLTCEVSELITSSKTVNQGDSVSESGSMNITVEAEFMKRFMKMEKDVESLKESASNQSYAESTLN